MEYDIRKQAMKNKRLRTRLVEYVNTHYHGHPIMGYIIADTVKIEAAQEGVYTTSEVLAKELRAIARRGALTRSHVIVRGTKFVQYSPASAGAQSHTPAGPASSGSTTTSSTNEGQTLLLDADAMTKPHHRRT